MGFKYKTNSECEIFLYFIPLNVKYFKPDYFVILNVISEQYSLKIFECNNGNILIDWNLVFICTRISSVMKHLIFQSINLRFL